MADVYHSAARRCLWTGPSDLDYETVAKEQNEIVEGAKKICENGSSTLLMVLAFVSLLVIPHIKLNNRGLFNVDKFEFYKN